MDGADAAAALDALDADVRNLTESRRQHSGVRSAVDAGLPAAE